MNREPIDNTKRHKNRNWFVTPYSEGSFSKDSAQLAVLMDVRDELQEIAAVLQDLRGGLQIAANNYYAQQRAKDEFQWNPIQLAASSPAAKRRARRNAKRKVSRKRSR